MYWVACKGKMDLAFPSWLFHIDQTKICICTNLTFTSLLLLLTVISGLFSIPGLQSQFFLYPGCSIF
jgi:hypothetical protein